MKLLKCPAYGSWKIESEAVGTLRERAGFSFPTAKFPLDVPLISLLHLSLES